MHKRCWQLGGTRGAGVLWQHPVPSFGVPQLTCNSHRAMVAVICQWLSFVLALSGLSISLTVNLLIVINYRSVKICHWSLVSGGRAARFSGPWRLGVVGVQVPGGQVFREE